MVRGRTERGVESEIEQCGEPFEMPPEPAIEREGAAIVTTVHLCGCACRSFIRTPGPPLRVTLDPNGRMLGWHPEKPAADRTGLLGFRRRRVILLSL